MAVEEPPVTIQGFDPLIATLAMVFKPVLETRKTWEKIKGHRLIPKFLTG
jgi:hypothetical protein